MLQRILFTTCGLLFVGLAALGAVLPVLPTTPFLLVAAACFAKSSPRLHQWLINNKVFGPLIVNWQQTRTIPRRAKRIALASIAIAASYSIYVVPSLALKCLVVGLLVFPVIFLIRLPETESLLDSNEQNTASTIN